MKIFGSLQKNIYLCNVFQTKTTFSNIKKITIMKKQNFNQVSSAAAAAQQVTNRAALNNAAKGAAQEIRSISPMYYINQLNKLARKNEFVEGVNLRDLGNMVKQQSGERDLFTLRVFSPDYQGRPCYIAKYKGEITAQDLARGEIVCDNRGNELRISAQDPEQVITYRAISLSLSGFISAFCAYLSPFAAEQDRAERAERKAERKAAQSAESKARAAARKAIKEQQRAAIERYNRGEMCIAEFAEIMSRVA